MEALKNVLKKQIIESSIETVAKKRNSGEVPHSYIAGVSNTLSDIIIKLNNETLLTNAEYIELESLLESAEYTELKED